MHHHHITSGTCSRAIDFDIDENGIIRNVRFEGGCHGNLQGIGRLVEGRHASDVAELLRGTDCKGKGTSCPDQLAQAIETALSH